MTTQTQTQTKTITVFCITATCMESGERVAITDDPWCGGDLHKLHGTRASAQERVAKLRGEMAKFDDVDPSTVYEVAECAVVVSEVAYDAAEGVVTARLTGGEYDREPLWIGVEPRFSWPCSDGLCVINPLWLGAGRAWDGLLAAVMLLMVTEQGVMA